MRDALERRQSPTILSGSAGVLLALLPVAFVLFFIASYAPNVPTFDNWWDPVWVAVKARSGTLSVGDIFVNAVGHRPVFIRLFSAGWAVLTDYNMGLGKYLAALNAFINLVLLIVVARRLKQPLLPAFELGRAHV